MTAAAPGLIKGKWRLAAQRLVSGVHAGRAARRSPRWGSAGADARVFAARYLYDAAGG